MNVMTQRVGLLEHSDTGQGILRASISIFGLRRRVYLKSVNKKACLVKSKSLKKYNLHFEGIE